MRKTFTAIALLIFFGQNVLAQDTLMYGTDRYWFSTRPSSIRYGYYESINNVDTIFAYAHIVIPAVNNDNMLMFNLCHSSEPVKIYGIAAIITYPDGIVDRNVTSILFTAGDSGLIYLDSTSIVTKQNYFIYDYDHIRTDSAGRLNRIVAMDTTIQQILPIYEFYFDSGITVQDSFFVAVSDVAMNSGYIPGYQRKRIAYQFCDTLGDKEWDYNSQAKLWSLCTQYSATFFHEFVNVNRYDYFPWGGIFPIIKPLNDTADSNGVQLVSAAESVRVEPNPAHGTVNVRAAEGLRRVELFDMTGLRVMCREVSGPEAHIDIAALPAGVYIVRVHTTTGTVSRKLVVF